MKYVAMCYFRDCLYALREDGTLVRIVENEVTHQLEISIVLLLPIGP